MTKEKLIEILNLLKEMNKKGNQVYKLGIDIIDFLDGYYVIINNFFNCIFVTEGYEFIDWWLYENVKKIIYEKNGVEINLEKVEDFSEYIIENYLLKEN
jgi:hypothetical protein